MQMGCQKDHQKDQKVVSEIPSKEREIIGCYWVSRFHQIYSKWLHQLVPVANTF